MEGKSIFRWTSLILSISCVVNLVACFRSFCSALNYYWQTFTTYHLKLLLSGRVYFSLNFLFWGYWTTRLNSSAHLLLCAHLCFETKKGPYFSTATVCDKRMKEKRAEGTKKREGSSKGLGSRSSCCSLFLALAYFPRFSVLAVFFFFFLLACEQNNNNNK